MATIVNERDVILQNANTRSTNPLEATVLLRSSSHTFHERDGVGTPSYVTITATRIGLEAPVVLTPSSGVLTEVTDVPNTTTTTAKLAYASITEFPVTVTATVISNGVTYSTSVSIGELTDGVQGEAGRPGDSVATATLYQWSSVEPTAPVGTSTLDWANVANTGYTGGDGWYTTPQANPGIPGVKLWVASKGVSAPAGTLTSAVDYTGASIAAFAQNGNDGAAGVKSTPVRLYRWASGPAPTVSGSSTYTWANNTFTDVPANWSTTKPDAPSVGYTLYEASVNLLESAGAATSQIDWTLAAVVGISYIGTNGAGTTGDSAAIAYVLVDGSSLAATPDTYEATGKTMPPASVWGNTRAFVSQAPVPAAGQSVFQSNGIYNAASGKTVWGVPYLSVFRVGSLSALTVNTGDLNISGIISSANGKFSVDDNGNVVAKSISIQDGNGNVILAAGTPLAPAYAAPGTRNSDFSDGTLNIGGDNLAPNSSFEKAVDHLATGYSIYNNGGSGEPTSAGTGTGRNGSGRSQIIAWTGNHIETKGIYGQMCKGGWLPGKTYIISFYAKTTSLSSVSYMTNEWNTHPAVSTWLLNPNLSTEWQRYAVRITMGATVEAGGVSFLSVLTGTGPGNVHFDDLMVTEGEVLTAYKPSTAEALGDAAAAKAAADAAMSQIDQMAANGILDRTEKTALVTEWQTEDLVWQQVRAQANNLGVPYAAYDASHNATSAYLLTLSPGWDDTTQNTSINRDEFRAYFKIMYRDRAALQNAVMEKASTLANSDNSIRTPIGGKFTTTVGLVKGAIKIRLPQLWTGTMMRFTVDIYEYVAGYSCTLEIAGYNYEAGYWINTTARVSGNSNVEYPVRFGHDGVKACVWIGNWDDEWAYPQVQVRDFFGGFYGATRSAWESGWQISFDEGGAINVSQEVIDTYPSADWNKTKGKPADSAILNGFISIGADGQLTGGGGGKVTLPGLGQRAFRVVSYGYNGGGTVPVAGGVYIDGTLYGTAVRSYALLVLLRSTREPIFHQTYDVYGEGSITAGRGAATLAADLNYFGSQHIVIVWTHDEPKTNRLTAGLDAAMYRCGASRAVFGSPNFKANAAYILVGIPGCGEGNGAEAYQGTVDGDPNAWCDLGFSISNSVITGVSTSYTPKSLTDYGYTGDLNATSNITLIGRGVEVTGNSLKKTGTVYEWDADAYSKESAPYAYASATVTSLSGIFFGLNDDPTLDATYTGIFANFYIQDGTGTGYASINTDYATSFAVAIGDVLRVSYDGVRVRWFKNGSQIREHTVDIGGVPLYFDSSFVAPGGTLGTCQFGPIPSALWSHTGGYGRPQDNATVGAPNGTYVGANLAENVDYWAQLGANANNAIPGINSAINDKLSKTSASDLAATVTLATGGSLLAGSTYNGAYMSPSGFYGVVNGSVKFSIPVGGNPTFAGELVAASGTLGSLHIAGGGGIHGGAYNSYAWPAAGSLGFYIGPEGFKCGSGNRYFNADQFGDVYAPNFTIVNGVITITSPTINNPVLSRPTISLSAGAMNGNSTSNTNRTFGSRTANISGGFASPVSYSWAVTSSESGNGTPFKLTLTNPTSATVTVSGQATNDAIIATITCTVTDANGLSDNKSFTLYQSFGTAL